MDFNMRVTVTLGNVVKKDRFYWLMLLFLSNLVDTFLCYQVGILPTAKGSAASGSRPLGWGGMAMYGYRRR